MGISALNKIIKAPGQQASETELEVCQALFDLENNVPDLTSELRALQFCAAKEVKMQGGKKAVAIFVPVPLLKSFRSIQQRLIRELEKKFSDRHVLIVAQRRILPKPNHKCRTKQKRPFSRTLTNVHEKILEDMVYPTEIVGRRTRVCVDGSKIVRV
jgi:small subunit ribosomal protein S7e